MKYINLFEKFIFSEKYRLFGSSIEDIINGLIWMYNNFDIIKAYIEPVDNYGKKLDYKKVHEDDIMLSTGENIRDWIIMIDDNSYYINVNFFNYNGNLLSKSKVPSLSRINNIFIKENLNITIKEGNIIR